MKRNINEFFPDIQSIESSDITGFAFVHDENNAPANLKKLNAVLDTDYDGLHYIIPLSEELDNKTLGDFIDKGWIFDGRQPFVQYVIALKNSDSANKIKKILMNGGYNVVLAPNGSQVIVKCLPESERNTAMELLKGDYSSQQQVDSKCDRRPSFLATLRERYNDFKLNYGTCLIPPVSDNYHIYHLSTQAALHREGERLNASLGIHYMDNVFHGYGIYSIRNNDGVPCMSLKVKGRKIVQCFVHKNTVPCDKQLRDTVRAFMEYREYGIPDNSFDKYIGYLNQNGNLYDMYNLSENIVIKNSLDLDELGLTELPNMRDVVMENDFSCCKNNLKYFTGAPDTIRGNCYFGNNCFESLRDFPHNIGGYISLFNNSNLTAESYVPDYVEEYIDHNKIFGINREILDAWKQQIATRKR